MNDLRFVISDMRASGKISADKVGLILLQMCDIIDCVPVPVPAAVLDPVVAEVTPAPDVPAITEAPVVIPQEDEEEDQDQEPDLPSAETAELDQEPVVKPKKLRRAKSTISA